MKKTFILMCIGILYSSCEEVIQLDLPNDTPRLVVDASLKMTPNESVNQIASFTGQAFKIPGKATPILLFGENYLNFLPDTAWVFTEETTSFGVEGWTQGAFRKYGQGRVVVFGEAAMFSAQLAGPQKIKAGMNNDVAPENYQLLLNIIHWLDGTLD